MMIKKRQEEFPHLPPINIREVEKNDVIKLGQPSVRFFGVTHTVPTRWASSSRPRGATSSSPAISSSIMRMASHPMKRSTVRYLQRHESACLLDGLDERLAARAFRFPNRTSTKHSKNIVKNTQQPPYHCNVCLALERLIRVMSSRRIR